jgi:ATP-binding cassette subfamily B protein
MKSSTQSGKFRRILAILRPDWKTCLLVVVITIIAGALGAVMPLLRGAVIDLINGGNPNNGTRLLIVLAAMTVLEAVILAMNFAASYKTNRLRQRTAFRLFSGILERIFQNDLASHEKEKAGEMWGRIHRGVFGFTETVFDTALSLIPALVFIAVAAGFMLALDWRLTLVTLGFAWIPVLISYKTGKVLEDKERQADKEWPAAYGRLLEGLTLFKIVKAFCMERREGGRCLDQLKKVQDLDVGALIYKDMASALKNLLSFSAQVAILGYGGYRVLRGEITLGTVIGFVAYSYALFEPMLGLAATYERFAKSKVHFDNVLRYLNTQPRVQDADNPVTPARLDGHLVFDNVCFAYGPDRPPVLKGVNFQIKPGQTIALAGRSGGGKTTIADLTLRFHDPDSGRITIDGIDLRTVPQMWWRQQIGLVVQDNRLFAGTIRDNIAYGKEDATDSEIEAAAQVAHAADFISGLPEGYLTQVGESGVGLSLGERQRVAIARAIIRNPRIVILDEATASLDVASERMVNEAMNALRKERTVMVIAHRLSTIANADLVLFLEDGQIVEQGTYKELIAQGGRFFRLAQEGGFESPQ